MGVYSEVPSHDLIDFARHAEHLFYFYKQVVDDVHAAGDGAQKTSAFDAATDPPNDVKESWDFVQVVRKVCILPIAGLGARHMGLL